MKRIVVATLTALMNGRLVCAILAGVLALLPTTACSSGLSRDKALAILELHNNELQPWEVTFTTDYMDDGVKGPPTLDGGHRSFSGPQVALFYRSMVENRLLTPPKRILHFNGITQFFTYRVATGVEGSTGVFLSLVIARARYSSVLGIQQTDKTATVEAELEYVLTETGKRYVEVAKSLSVPISQLVVNSDPPGETANPISPPKIVQRYAFTKWDDGWRLGGAR